MEALMQPLLQSSLSAFFFSFAASFFLFSLLLMLLRWRPWCACDVCSAYVTSSWVDDGFHNLADWYAHLLRRSPTHTIHIHVLGNTITAHPANVEHMLKTRFDNYPKGKPFSAILGDLLGRGIFAVDGDPWLFQRKMASLELGSVSVRSYAFQIVSAELRRRLLPLMASVAVSRDGGGRGSVLDLQDVFRRFSFDTICRISFGLDPGCLDLGQPLSEFAAAFDEASRLSAARALSVWPLVWKAKRLLNVGSERELRRAVRLIDVLSQEVIRQRRLAGKATSGHDLLSRFLGITDDGRYLRDIVISFMLAGRDTVASGLTTFFLLLSKYPDVEAKILENIKQATAGGGASGHGGDVVGEELEGSDDREVASYAQLREMHYVHAALYESMRLYPPVQFDSRFAKEDDMLPDGTFVRRGTRLTYHPYAMGRMEELWGADCHEFRPERWLNGDGTFVPLSPFRYPVFHAGSRICLGKELALMEMKNVVVSVVRRFRVEVLDEGHPPNFASGLTATLAGGLPARFRVR